MKRRWPLALLVLTALVVFALSGCAGASSLAVGTTPVAQTKQNSTSGTGVAAATVTPVAKAQTAASSTASTKQASTTSTTITATVSSAFTNESDDGGVSIVLGHPTAVGGAGATVSGSVVTITAGGTYRVSGTLDEGQIVVTAGDKDTVKIILDGANLTCSSSAPIYVTSAKAVVIVLADGSNNYVKDGEAYGNVDAESGEPNAAIFSKSDLTITGSGSLSVAANHNDGIASKDELTIASGSITIDSVGDGLRGRDFVAVLAGNVTVNAKADGFKSTNDEDAAKGFVYIQGGTINIAAGEDGIQAETRVAILGGNLTITSGGGSANSSIDRGQAGNTWGNWNARPGTNTGPATSATNTATSAQGINANVDITIAGGTIHIDSSDDSLNSNKSMTIDGGEFVLTSGDDGMHADETLVINGGTIDITKCYEGIESAIITINDGDIHVVASDDALNVAGGADSSAMGGRPGQNTFNVSNGQYLQINGGHIVVDAIGDGLDINGSIAMTGGTVIVNGPTNDGNGALDYDSGFKMTGGYLIAVGSAGMAQAPSSTSTQYAVMVNLASAQAAGTLVHIQSSDGKDILTFKPTKAYRSVVLCSPELKNGTTYTVYTGGSSTGTVADGLYTGGKYTAGAQAASFTISSVITAVGSSMGAMPAGRR